MRYKRMKIYRAGRMTTHWPYPVHVFPAKPRLYAGQTLPELGVVTPPAPTLAMRKLIGY